MIGAGLKREMITCCSFGMHLPVPDSVVRGPGDPFWLAQCEFCQLPITGIPLELMPSLQLPAEPLLESLVMDRVWLGPPRLFVIHEHP